jgi:hypothetical protein
MRRICSVIAGVALAMAPTGCSESPPEGGTVDYKGSNSAAIEGFTKQMSANVKAKTYLKTGEAEPKPGMGTKSSIKPEEKKP